RRPGEPDERGDVHLERAGRVVAPAPDGDAGRAATAPDALGRPPRQAFRRSIRRGCERLCRRADGTGRRRADRADVVERAGRAGGRRTVTSFAPIATPATMPAWCVAARHGSS